MFVDDKSECVLMYCELVCSFVFETLKNVENVTRYEVGASLE